MFYLNMFKSSFRSFLQCLKISITLCLIIYQKSAVFALDNCLDSHLQTAKSKVAVINIGFDTYFHGTNLPGVGRDIKTYETILGRVSSNQTKITSDNFTKKAINGRPPEEVKRGFLRNITESVKEKEFAIISYSGHGSRGGDEFYIVLPNIPKFCGEWDPNTRGLSRDEEPEARQSGQAQFKSPCQEEKCKNYCISSQELQEALGPTIQMVGFFDACYSGTLLKSKIKASVITATSPDQTALDGAFTNALEKVIREYACSADSDRNGALNFLELSKLAIKPEEGRGPQKGLQRESNTCLSPPTKGIGRTEYSPQTGVFSNYITVECSNGAAEFQRKTPKQIPMAYTKNASISLKCLNIISGFEPLCHDRSDHLPLYEVRNADLLDSSGKKVCNFTGKVGLVDVLDDSKNVKVKLISGDQVTPCSLNKYYNIDKQKLVIYFGNENRPKDISKSKNDNR